MPLHTALGKRFGSARRLLFSCDLRKNPTFYSHSCDVADSYLHRFDLLRPPSGCSVRCPRYAGLSVGTLDAHSVEGASLGVERADALDSKVHGEGARRVDEKRGVKR